MLTEAKTNDIYFAILRRNHHYL